MDMTTLRWLFPLCLFMIAVFLFYYSRRLYRWYQSETDEGLARTGSLPDSILTPEDIAHLPQPIQNYLKYVGVIGKNKVKSLRVMIDGSLKPDKEKDWAAVKVEQHSFFDHITRLFFLKLNMSGLPVIGLHAYKNANAVMLIQAAGLLTVVEGRGKEMDRAETVTVLNDMCFLAPASLIDPRIQWEPIDALTVKAVFNNEGIKISAKLYFNETGQLINFVSDDRYYSPTGKTFENIRWSTPISNYKNINGFNLPTYGEAIWHFPEEDFCYARFNIREVEYNCKTSRKHTKRPD